MSGRESPRRRSQSAKRSSRYVFPLNHQEKVFQDHTAERQAGVMMRPRSGAAEPPRQMFPSLDEDEDTFVQQKPRETSVTPSQAGPTPHQEKETLSMGNLKDTQHDPPVKEEPGPLQNTGGADRPVLGFGGRSSRRRQRNRGNWAGWRTHSKAPNRFRPQQAIFSRKNKPHHSVPRVLFPKKRGRIWTHSLVERCRMRHTGQGPLRGFSQS